ncbi:MAG: hypothetical protein JO309_12525 [Pseudonocardiales bacterium]|nr:hypothetical protein [Pseudonocardiales bacterium]MBV9730202.1 hypothetical protein [Pseudonocardiales bacterium]
MSQWASIEPRRRATAWPEETSRALVTADPASDMNTAMLRSSTLYRFIMGLDSTFTEMTPSEMSALGDPLAQLLTGGVFPLTVDKLLDELNARGVLPKQSSFLISEVGQIPPAQATSLARDMRFAIVRSRSSRADLLISTSAVGNPHTVFLQVAAWDDHTELFNYYMRLGGAWVWAGNSYHALAPPSRGNGPFDSHINGSLVMKELKQPWMNWQSQNATILLDENDPLRQKSLYQNLSGAESLESIVRDGIARWTTARLKHTMTTEGQITHVDWLLRQLCITTTVNLASSTTTSAMAVADQSVELRPPLSFWFNNNGLIDGLNIPLRDDFTPPVVTAKLYADSLVRYDFALTQGEFTQKGDTFFAFVVPEVAFEDIDVVNQMVSREILTAHFAASVLMVDFPNPVFSGARAKLLQYVPTEAKLDIAGGGLSRQIADTIITSAASHQAGTPEAEFRANWELADSDWQNSFAARIEDYMTAVSTRIATAQGFDDYVRLAESRRREFKTMRLNEFSLTLPKTNIPLEAPLLQMQPNGTVREKTRTA